MTTKINSTNWVDFDISIGIRIKLTADQKAEIKRAYDEKLYGENKESSSTSTRGGLRVETQFNAPQLTQAMGCDRYTLASLLGSNERYSVSQLQKWEKALDLKLVNEKDVDAAWKSYKQHVFKKEAK